MGVDTSVFSSWGWGLACSTGCLGGWGAGPLGGWVGGWAGGVHLWERNQAEGHHWPPHPPSGCGRQAATGAVSRLPQAGEGWPHATVPYDARQGVTGTHAPCTHAQGAHPPSVTSAQRPLLTLAVNSAPPHLCCAQRPLPTSAAPSVSPPYLREERRVVAGGAHQRQISCRLAAGGRSLAVMLTQNSPAGVALPWLFKLQCSSSSSSSSDPPQSQ